MVEATNLTKEKISIPHFKDVAGKTFRIIKSTFNLNIVFVSENFIKQINHKYRRKNKSTDVLAFEELNEIFICPEFVKKQAKELHVAYLDQLTRVLIHGILHVVGYDHERTEQEATNMFATQERILKKLDNHY